MLHKNLTNDHAPSKNLKSDHAPSKNLKSDHAPSKKEYDRVPSKCDKWPQNLVERGHFSNSGGTLF